MAIANSVTSPTFDRGSEHCQDNGEKLCLRDGYIKSMSGDLRTAARRVAKELSTDAAMSAAAAQRDPAPWRHTGSRIDDSNRLSERTSFKFAEEN